jgi:hypothetical protein
VRSARARNLSSARTSAPADLGGGSTAAAAPNAVTRGVEVLVGALRPADCGYAAAERGQQGAAQRPNGCAPRDAAQGGAACSPPPGVLQGA